MAFKPAASRTVVPRKVVCHAHRQESVKQIGSALAATALAAALSLSAVDAAKADVAGLTPCSESKPYAKRQKNEVKALQKRMKQVRLMAHQSTAQHCIKRHHRISTWRHQPVTQYQYSAEDFRVSPKHWSQMHLEPAESCLIHLQYEADSAPAIALQATIDRTEKRFATYAKQGLLCGTDGLPHLISDPGLAIRYGHTGETLVNPVTRCCICHPVALPAL